MINCKRGITLISIVLIVVVISIVSGIVTISTNHILDNTYKKEFFSEYNLVKSYTGDYILRNSGKIYFEETEFDLTKVERKYTNQFVDETIVSNKIDMYIIDLEEIGVYNATYGTGKNGEDDVYLVSKGTNNVYYMKGFKSGDLIYYKAINE